MEDTLTKDTSATGLTLDQELMIVARQRGAIVLANRLVDAGLIGSLTISRCLNDTLDDLKNPDL